MDMCIAQTLDSQHDTILASFQLSLHQVPAARNTNLLTTAAPDSVTIPDTVRGVGPGSRSRISDETLSENLPDESSTGLTDKVRQCYLLGLQYGESV